MQNPGVQAGASRDLLSFGWSQRSAYMKHALIAIPLALTACNEPVRLGPLPPPPDKLVCEEMPERPDLKPLEAFKLPDGTLAYRKADVDARDGHIARYIIALNGAYFDCRRTVDWNRTYWETAE